MFRFRKKYDMEAIRKTIDPSSKLTMKMSILSSCGGDLERAEKMYKFLADGMELPDMPPVKPSIMEQIKGYANEVMGFANENKDTINDVISFVQALRGKGSIVPQQATQEVLQNIPPLNIE